MAVVLVVIGVLASPSEATGRPTRLAPAQPFVFTDPAGDGNMLTTEGFGSLGVPRRTQPTPVQRDDTDIRRAQIARIANANGDRVVGIEVRLTLSAPPGPLVAYFLAASTKKCNNFIFEYHSDAVSSTGSYFLHNCGNALGSGGSKPVATVVRGNDIVWTLPLSALPKAVPLGTELFDIVAYTRNNVAIVYPSYDLAFATGTYLIGS